MTAYELPEKPERWTPKRRTEVCRAVIGGYIEPEAASARYGLAPDELKSWIEAYERAALAGNSGSMKLKAMIEDRTRTPPTTMRALWTHKAEIRAARSIAVFARQLLAHPSTTQTQVQAA